MVEGEQLVAALPARERLWWASAAFVVLFNLALGAWLLFELGSPAQIVAVDGVAQFAGPFLVVPLCFSTLLGGRRRAAGAASSALPAVTRGRRWAPFLLGLGVAAYALGGIIWTYDEQILRQLSFPSWADAGYLSVYPFLLLGILLLPVRPLVLVARGRTILDGLMVMIAVVTFSWYIVLGPTLEQGAATPLTRIVGAAYPVGDLLLVYCMVRLSSRVTREAPRRAVSLLVAGLALIVAADTVFDFQQLDNTYRTGELLDAGWPLGYMAVGLAAQALRLHEGAAPVVPSSPDRAATPASPAPLWRALLPYAPVPAVGALLVWTWHASGDIFLQAGVYIGSAALVGLLLLRQIAVLVENQRLHGTVRAPAPGWSRSTAVAKRGRARRPR